MNDNQSLPSPRPERYRRHESFFDSAAWKRLTTTRVVVAGVGGLGSHVLSSLARLGPIDLCLWDPGVIDEPDLNRQILYTPEDLGKAKAVRAAERLREINPAISVESFPDPVSKGAVERVVEGAPAVVFDCLDSFHARGVVEDLRTGGIGPVFHGGVEGWYGQVTTLQTAGGGYARAFGPAFRELPTAAKPILATTVAVVAALQVGEFVHWCRSGNTTPLSDVLLMYDGMGLRFDRIELQPGEA